MGPKPRGPVGAASMSAGPRGHDGCLAGAPLARRLVPGLGLHLRPYPSWRGPRPQAQEWARLGSPPHSPCCPRPQPPSLPPSAVGGRSRGGGMEGTLSSSIGDICSKRVAVGGEVSAEVGAAEPAAAPPTTFPSDFWPRSRWWGLGVGRGRSRPVPHITTPMKFPMGGHEAGSPSPAAPPLSPPSDRTLPRKPLPSSRRRSLGSQEPPAGLQ